MTARFNALKRDAVERHYRYGEVAELLGVPASTVRHWARTNRFRRVKTGEGRTARVLIPHSALVEFLEMGMVQPGDGAVA